MINNLTATNCMQCECSLENTGTVTTYDRKMNPIKVICERCDLRNHFQEWQTDGIITTRLLTEAVINAEIRHRSIQHGAWTKEAAARAALTPEEGQPLQDIHTELSDMARAIELKIWFDGGLQKYVRASKFKGAKFKMSDGDILLVYAMAGRCRLSLQTKDEDHFTVQCAESSSRGTMGYIGVAAKMDTVRSLFTKLIAEFNVNRVKVDNKVGIF